MTRISATTAVSDGRLEGASASDLHARLSLHYSLRGLREAVGWGRVLAATGEDPEDASDAASAAAVTVTRAGDAIESWKIETLQRYMTALGRCMEPVASIGGGTIVVERDRVVSGVPLRAVG